MSLPSLTARPCVNRECGYWSVRLDGLCVRCVERGVIAPPVPPLPTLRRDGADRSEAEVQQLCIEVLEDAGWTVRRCGTWRADYAGSDAGLPDLVCLKPAQGILLVEVKRSHGGVVSDAQEQFMRECRAAGVPYILTNSPHHLFAQLVGLYQH